MSSCTYECMRNLEEELRRKRAEKRHKTKTLYKSHCRECRKEVIVSAVSPNKFFSELTGIWVRRMTDNGVKNAGFLCVDCMKFDSKKYSYGFGGGEIGNLDLWEAYVEAVE